MEFLPRLVFEQVFPNEKAENIMQYLKNISQHTLENISGFTCTFPIKNYNNFFNSNTIQKEINKKIDSTNHSTKIPFNLISRKASLQLTEIILSNKEELFNKKKLNIDQIDIDNDEMNLFKAYLVINTKLSETQNAQFTYVNTDDVFQNILNSTISSGFSQIKSEGQTNEVINTLEFTELALSNYIKFKELTKFINSNEEYLYLKQALLDHFNTNNLEYVTEQVRMLFLILIRMKQENYYKFDIENTNSLILDKNFCDCLVAKKVNVDADFTNLRSFPLFKINESIYSIIDFPFVVNFFETGIKFILKNAFEDYNNKHNIKSNFFQFFNTKYSENWLMNNTLDNIFDKSYYKKKLDIKDSNREPDYYIRHNNCIFIFEFKETLLNKTIKESFNLDEIKSTLKTKFLRTTERDVGIGQLVNSIKDITDNNFPFDPYVNTKKNITIFPILLVGNNSLDVPGINFMFNEWYIELIKEKLGDNYNINFIKNLSFLNLDTLIMWSGNLKNNSRQFKQLLKLHLHEMNKIPKLEKRKGELNIKILKKKLSPLSFRIPRESNIEFFLNSFDFFEKDLLR